MVTNNKIKYILFFLAGNLSLCILHNCKVTKKNIDDKNRKYCQLFDNWLNLSERGDTLEQFFKKRNMKNIAVYGYGNIGRHLVTQLSGSDIHIKYVIDKRKDSIITNDLPCYQLSDNMPSVDVIVITPICEYLEITNKLKRVTSAKIISMEDVIYELI